MTGATGSMTSGGGPAVVGGPLCRRPSPMLPIAIRPKGEQAQNDAGCEQRGAECGQAGKRANGAAQEFVARGRAAAGRDDKKRDIGAQSDQCGNGVLVVQDLPFGCVGLLRGKVVVQDGRQQTIGVRHPFVPAHPCTLKRSASGPDVDGTHGDVDATSRGRGVLNNRAGVSIVIDGCRDDRLPSARGRSAHQYRLPTDHPEFGHPGRDFQAGAAQPVGHDRIGEPMPKLSQYRRGDIVGFIANASRQWRDKEPSLDGCHRRHGFTSSEDGSMPNRVGRLVGPGFDQGRGGRPRARSWWPPAVSTSGPEISGTPIG
jgi:hypothetical protein